MPRAGGGTLYGFLCGRARVPIALLLLLTACAPEAATREGERVKSLYDTFLVIAAVIFVVTAGLIAWSLIRYRERAAARAPASWHSNVALEATWFAIPQVLVVVLFVMSLGVMLKIDDTSNDALEVGVRSFQWGWRFTYEDDGHEIVSTPQDPARVVLPVGRPIQFSLTSADVVHAFYVTRFLLKRDTIPGREQHLEVTIDDPGTYDGKCAEFCGLLHDRMDFTIEAVAPEDFERWLDGRR